MSLSSPLSLATTYLLYICSSNLATSGLTRVPVPYGFIDWGTTELVILVAGSLGILVGWVTSASGFLWAAL